MNGGVPERKRRTPGEVVLAAVDYGVESRWTAATKRASGVSGATLDERVREVQRSFRRELTVVGAAAGATAAVPGVGTVSAVAAASGELTVVTARSADLILTIGALHGLDQASIEERRAWVLSVLVFGEAASSGFTRLASELGKGLGSRATARVPTATLQSINRRLGRTILTKYGTKRGAVAIGRLLPFGIGAGIGGGANYLLITGIGRHANAFFSELPGPLASSSPQPIEVWASERRPVPSLSSEEVQSRPLTRPTTTRSLAEPSMVDERELAIDLPHVAPLNGWVRTLREREPTAIVPWFDPMDAGTNARILWLLEAPGPKATRERGGSGFVSIDNNDRTAEITAETMSEAGVDRGLVAVWNAVPHYLGDAQRIAPHKKTDIENAGPLLEELLALLPEVRAVILGGKAAQELWSRHSPAKADRVVAISCPHPSPRNVNTRPEARSQIVDAWRRALAAAS